MRTAFSRMIALAIFVVPASVAHAQDYPFDIKKKFPAAFKAWQAIAPREYAKMPWIASLDGTGSPMDRVTFHGRAFLLGSNCKPHDCGGNFVAFLVALDGKDAYGALASDTLKVKRRYFGASDDEARKMLDQKLAE